MHTFLSLALSPYLPRGYLKLLSALLPASASPSYAPLPLLALHGCDHTGNALLTPFGWDPPDTHQFCPRTVCNLLHKCQVPH